MKKKILFLALFLVLCSLLTSMPLYAATIRTFTVTPTSTTFADQDPDLGEVTSSPSLSVTISVRQLYANQTWTLAISATTDLVSGGNTIPAGNIRWTVTGSGTPTPTFYNGTLVRGVYLQAGTGPGRNNGRADITASFYFYLTNAWSYPTGNYSGTVTLRLTVPGAVHTTSDPDRYPVHEHRIKGKAAIRIAGNEFSGCEPGYCKPYPCEREPPLCHFKRKNGFNADSDSNLSCKWGSRFRIRHHRHQQYDMDCNRNRLCAGHHE